MTRPQKSFPYKFPLDEAKKAESLSAIRIEAARKRIRHYPAFGEPDSFSLLEALDPPGCPPACRHTSGAYPAQTAYGRYRDAGRLFRVPCRRRKYSTQPCGEPVLLAYGRA